MENALRPDFDCTDEPSLGCLQALFYDVSDGRVRLVKERRDMPMPLPFRADARLITEENLTWLRKTVARTAKKLGFTEARIEGLVLAVGEAAMNAVVHAGGGDMQISWDEDGRLAVMLEDVGTGICLNELPRVLFCRGYSTVGHLGQGFSLVRAFVDRLWIYTHSKGTTLVLEMSSDPGRDFGWIEGLAGALVIPRRP